MYKEIQGWNISVGSLYSGILRGLSMSSWTSMYLITCADHTSPEQMMADEIVLVEIAMINFGSKIMGSHNYATLHALDLPHMPISHTRTQFTFPKLSQHACCTLVSMFTASRVTT